MKIVVWVTTTMRLGAGGVSNNLQFPFEVEAHGLDHLFYMLRADGAVIGDKLQLRRTGDTDVREVVDRQQTVLTLGGVAMLQEQRGRVIEVEEVSADG